MKLLVIEDDTGLNRGISFALEQEGYEVETRLVGLGELQAIRDIYVEHTQASVDSL